MFGKDANILFTARGMSLQVGVHGFLRHLLRYRGGTHDLN